MHTLLRSVAACLALTLAGCGTADAPDPDETESRRANLPARGEVSHALDGCDIVVEKASLVIDQLSVVEDPVRTSWNGDLDDPYSGAWHFGRLMADMSGPIDPALFVEHWLFRWTRDRQANGQVVEARPGIASLIDDWPRLADGSLDLTRPPLRLLAIINRVDLRDGQRAGEGRFVFGVLDAQGNPQPFTIILEYNLPLHVATAAQWANGFRRLSDLDPDGGYYRSYLQYLTDSFSRAGAAPGAINGSAISQVRTNEIALGSPWQLREFTLSPNRFLRHNPVALTPGNGHNGTGELARFINENEADILSLGHDVPLTFGVDPATGEPIRFLGGSSEVPFGSFWDAPGINNNDARHAFALSTCNGCHGSETGTLFVHIDNRRAGETAALSPFMTGGVVGDPVDGTERAFGDIARRQRDMEALLCSVR